MLSHLALAVWLAAVGGVTAQTEWPAAICMGLVSQDLPATGMMGFMIAMLVLGCVGLVIGRVLKPLGKLSARRSHLTQQTVSFVLMICFFLAMGRNLVVYLSLNPLSLCGVEKRLFPGCQSHLDLSNDVLGILPVVVNYIFGFVLMILLTAYHFTRSKFSDLQRTTTTLSNVTVRLKVLCFILWVCTFGCRGDVPLDWALDTMRHLGFLLLPLSVSPGLATLATIPLSRDCMVAMDSELIVLMYLQLGNGVGLLVYIVIAVFWLSIKLTLDVFAVLLAKYMCVGLLLFVAQLVLGLSISVGVGRAYLLTVLFTVFPLSLTLLGALLERHFQPKERQLLHAPVRGLTAELLDPSNFWLATPSMDRAIAAIENLFQLPPNFVQELRSKQTLLASLQQMGLTVDESLAVLGWDTPLESHVSEALQTYRQSDVYSTLWDQQVKGKAALLPYLFLLYAGLSKMPRVGGQQHVYCSWSWFTDDGTLLAPLDAVFVRMSVSSMLRASQSLAEESARACQPYPLLMTIVTAQTSTARDLGLIQPGAVWFASDVTFATQIAVQASPNDVHEATVEEVVGAEDFVNVFALPQYQGFVAAQVGPRPAWGGEAAPLATTTLPVSGNALAGSFVNNNNNNNHKK